MKTIYGVIIFILIIGHAHSQSDGVRKKQYNVKTSQSNLTKFTANPANMNQPMAVGASLPWVSRVKKVGQQHIDRLEKIDRSGRPQWG